MSRLNLFQSARLFILAATLLFTTMIATSQGAPEPATGPQGISADAPCGKCGMFPARYPHWQTQIVFNDGKMTPFDGCKCMFGFLLTMDKPDQEHSPADVAAIWVREFNTGNWIDAQKAIYVIGSDEMGPMGKELIPFADAASAESFEKEHGGQIALYDAINMGTLKPLMGKMHMKKKDM